MQRLFSRFFRVVIFTGSIFVCFHTLAIETKVEKLKPEAVQSKTAIEIVNQLNKHHYRQQQFNDALSSRFLDEYLKTLDSSKNIFLGSDIAEFEAYRKKFDDDLKAGKLDSSFAIYNRFSERFIHRLDEAITLLDNKEAVFNFDVEESMIVDRKSETWPATQADADKLWQQFIKSNLLNSMLSGKTLEESKTTLRKRYANQLRRMKQQTSEEAFSIMMNALTLLYDPHTNYLSPDNSKNFNISMSLSLQGIGAVLQSDEDYTKVISLVPGGPADKQGQLKPNDKIVAIAQGAKGEFEDVVGWRLDEVVKKVRGEKDTIVRLEVIPSNPTATGNTIIAIKRETVKLEDQAAKKAVFNIKNGEKTYKLGVIDIPTFYMDFEAYNRRDPNYKSTTRDVYKLLDELHKDNVDGVIIDLRDNGGGSLPEAAMLTDLFINPGPVVQIRQSDNTISRDYRATNPAVYRGPLIVVTNRLSASASEIFAGAIQDYGRGLIVGSTTFGKGTVQTMMPISKGEGDLKITQSKFYRVSGDSTQHRGVIPDLELPTLINNKDIGESSYETALPWDQIHPAPHDFYYDIAGLVTQLNPAHQERMKTDPDFIFLKQQSALYEEISNKKVVSLRLATRQKEQEKLEQRTLEIENQKRKTKGQAVYANYADYKAKELKKDEDDDTPDPQKKELEPEKDPYLMESGKIMADLIVKMETQPVKKVANQ
ncbi:MAG TPA: carboxy terminal-processing peptidase [Cellvibrio sp.]|nr:carboxy terminal-processing peptidase [Cellvibrio sp.]